MSAVRGEEGVLPAESQLVPCHWVFWDIIPDTLSLQCGLLLPAWAPRQGHQQEQQASSVSGATFAGVPTALTLSYRLF